MILYDGLTQPLQQEVYVFGIATLVFLALCLVWRLTGRRLKWYVPAAIALFGLLGGAVPVWDQARVRKLASEGGLMITRGLITQVWHLETRHRDMTNKSSISYRKSIDEGFDLGTERFAWRPGSCLSAASLCRLDPGGVKLAEGMAVDVHWFKDAAQDDNQRVVILRKLEPAFLPTVEPQSGK